MVSRSILLPREAATCREFTARLMSPRAIRTRPLSASSAISTFSFLTILRMYSERSASVRGLNLNTAHLDWIGSMILDE